MMAAQSSQFNPFYAFQTVGFFGAAPAATVESGWGGWKPQVEPFPVHIVTWFPTPGTDELVRYVSEMVGTGADLDPNLEAAGVEYLIRDDQTAKR